MTRIKLLCPRNLTLIYHYLGYPDGSKGKNLPVMWETRVQSLRRKDPLEKGMATHSSILA